MLLLPLLLFAAAALAQESTIDPSILITIFGTPPSGTTPPMPRPGETTSLRPQDATVRPTDANTRFTDSSGTACKCVPYYLCDSDLNGVNINNETVTGWGKLDIRFGEDDCQESVERCCTEPRTNVRPPPTAAPRRAGCGHSNPGGLDVTITGGTGDEAGFGEYPWVVPLLTTAGLYAGVGVLIHPQVVMTAAHIANRHTASTLKVRAGEWDTQTIKERLPHQERLVSEIVKHADFHPKSLRNDIALLRLDAPVELAEHIQVLCMPEQDESFDQYKNCVSNGWGQDVFGQAGRYAVIVKKVLQDMVPHRRCNELLKATRLGPRFKLHPKFVCSAGEDGKDTCTGDGGAPLACPIGNNRFKLAGLVSWGIGCGTKDVPAVSAAVASFRQWTDDQMRAWGFETSGYQL